MVKITYYNRKFNSGFSIERIFLLLSSNLPANFIVKNCFNKFQSKGIVRRVLNIFLAIFNQGDINHVTGDVHYITYLLNYKKNILTIHDCGMLINKSLIKRLTLYIFWFYLPVLCSKIVVTVSEKTRTDLLKILKCNPNKIRVINNPVDPIFKYTNKNFNSSLPRILHIGSNGNKNLIRHIYALQNIPCIFIIIGILNEYDLKILVESGIRYEIKYNLSNDEIFEQYCLSDVVLFASTFEGFGMPVIEAQSTGRVVITSNIEPMKSIAGDGACLVDPLNIFSIRSGVIKVITDEKYRNLLINNGFHNSKKYSLNHFVSEYVKLYDELRLSEQ
jgi:glycosyltransferase involved in cell wall biosynthesis